MTTVSEIPLADLRFVIIAGPTVVGKSAFAVSLAQACHTEILNADVFQMYKGFDVLAAKPALEELATVPHHLLSFVEAADNFDAFRFARLAGSKIRDLNRAGIVPLVVGGAGFYLQALTHSLPVLPPADSALRERLARRPLASLLAELQILDPDSLANIDRSNPRRIVRALEVCLLTGKRFSSFRRSSSGNRWKAVFLDRPRWALDERIKERVSQMLAQGAVEEAADHSGLRTGAARMIGFRFIGEYLCGKLSFDACHENICAQTRQYARRQFTWFRSQGYQAVDPASAFPLAADFFNELADARASAGQSP